VDEGTEGQTVSPGGGEVFNLHIVIFSGSALAPDEDGLHLGGHHLRPSNSGDSELQRHTSMGCHASTLAVRVEAGRWVLGFLDETGHVLQEQVVHVLLVHVAQLDAGAGLLVSGHDGDVL